MINPEEKVEYTLYLKHTEKTLSNKLQYPIDIYGQRPPKKVRGP